MNNDDLVPGFDGLSEEPWQFRLQPWDGAEAGLVIHTFGPLHRYNEDVFFRKMELVADRGYRRVVLDLAGSIWPDEGLYGRLRVLQNLLVDRGGALVVVRMHPQVELSFDLRQEDKAALNPRRTLEEASAFFHAREGHFTEAVFPTSGNCPFCGRAYRAYRPGTFQCSPDRCGWSIRIGEDGGPRPYHDHLIPGFDAGDFPGLVVSVTPLEGMVKGLLFRHRGSFGAEDASVYRRKLDLVEAAGFDRLAFDVSALGAVRYPEVHRGLFEKNLPRALGYVLVGVPPRWASFWEQGLCPPPPCALAESLDDARELLRLMPLKR